MTNHNQDYLPPWAVSFPLGPVIPTSHLLQTDLPIYWGPGQLSPNYPDYDPPDMKAWHVNELLSIPQVCRFIYDADSSVDPSIYNNTVPPPPPPGPPPPPVPPLQIWTAVGVADYSMYFPIPPATVITYYTYVQQVQFSDGNGHIANWYNFFAGGTLYKLGDQVYFVPTVETPTLQALFDASLPVYSALEPGLTKKAYPYP